MPFGNSVTRLLNIPINRTTRTPLQLHLTLTPCASSTTIKHRSLHNVTSDIPSLAIELPNANPRKTHTLRVAVVIVVVTTLIHRHAFLIHELLPPVPRGGAPIAPREHASPFRNPVLPTPLVTVPVLPHQHTLPGDGAVLPLPDVLIPVAPRVPPLPLLQVAPPPPLVHVPVRVPLLPEPVLPVREPRAAVRVAFHADEGPVPVHPPGGELPLVGSAGGPREPPLPARLSLPPLSLVHAPVRPEILAAAMRRVSREAAAVDVAVGQRPLHRAGRHAARPRRTATRRRRQEELDVLGGCVVVFLLLRQCEQRLLHFCSAPTKHSVTFQKPLATL